MSSAAIVINASRVKIQTTHMYHRFRYKALFFQPKSTDIFLTSLQKHMLWVGCVAVLRPSQPNGVISSAVSLPNHTFTGQA